MHTQTFVQIVLRWEMASGRYIIMSTPSQKTQGNHRLEVDIYCYTSQLKYFFRLEENVPRVVGQNSLPP